MVELSSIVKFIGLNMMPEGKAVPVKKIGRDRGR